MVLTYDELITLLRAAHADSPADEPIYIRFDTRKAAAVEETICCQSLEASRVHIDLNAESRVVGIELA